jgi:hypothetical protein
MRNQYKINTINTKKFFRLFLTDPSKKPLTLAWSWSENSRAGLVKVSAKSKPITSNEFPY